MQLLNFIKENTRLPLKGIESTVQLLNEDGTIPSISRYWICNKKQEKY